MEASLLILLLQLEHRLQQQPAAVCLQAASLGRPQYALFPDRSQTSDAEFQSGKLIIISIKILDIAPGRRTMHSCADFG